MVRIVWFIILNIETEYRLHRSQENNLFDLLIVLPISCFALHVHLRFYRLPGLFYILYVRQLKPPGSQPTSGAKHQYRITNFFLNIFPIVRSHLQSETNSIFMDQ